MLHSRIEPVVTVSRLTIAAWFALAFALAAAVAVINPVGYIGGGSDDEQYLAAARCWVAHGVPCFPQAHWWIRWPAYAPIAAFTGLLGESRLTVGFGPAFYWAATIGLTGLLGQLWFGWRAGAAAMVLIGGAPVIAANAFEPNADLPELAFQLAGLAAATFAFRRQSALLAILAGVFGALALQTRETSAITIAACGVMWLTLPRGRRNVLLWASIGMAAPILLEMLIYKVGSGDGIARYRMAMPRMAVTTELPANFHSDRGPLLNLDFIRAWKREAGITVWWPIDPWLNLICSPRTAMILCASVTALIVFRRDLAVAQRRRIRRLLIPGVIIALVLVYGLGGDPKPRLFMTLWAALALAAGAAITAGLTTSKWPIAAMLLVIAPVTGASVLAHYPSSVPAEQRARIWIVRYGDAIELDKGAASYLALLPEARALAPQGSGRRFVAMISITACAQMIDRQDGRANGRVVDEVGGSASGGNRLCLFEYLPVRRGAAAR